MLITTYTNEQDRKGKKMIDKFNNLDGELLRVTNLITNRLIDVANEENIYDKDLKRFLKNELTEKSYIDYETEDNIISIDLIDNIHLEGVFNIGAFINYIMLQKNKDFLLTQTNI